ncbi:MAG: SCP2 sterol-binding domain-containing protein [Micavibrio sp.]|nr:SCP2 sterol-binding domain-containing protein [Micavibrio sp.]MBK9562097.1 SCP2 sterol-binding domain-containing protein [Micavibrio sp.]
MPAIIASYSNDSGYKDEKTYRFQNFPRVLLAPVPLPIIQPVLKHIVTSIATHRPELFARLGPHKNTVFLIDPINLPFILRLHPNPQKPSLTAHRRWGKQAGGARIAGSFLTLLNMIDGKLDGDALFFSRDLAVEGDTEAIVCLRNTLDDMEGSVIMDTAGLFGPPGRAFLEILNKIRMNA